MPNTFLATILDQGFTVRLKTRENGEDALGVSPSAALTPELRTFIRLHKTELVAECKKEALLNSGPPTNDSRQWDFQRGWWKDEVGPIRVTGWTKDGRAITLLANDEAQAEELRQRDMPGHE